MTSKEHHMGTCSGQEVSDIRCRKFVWALRIARILLPYILPISVLGCFLLATGNLGPHSGLPLKN